VRRLLVALSVVIGVLLAAPAAPVSNGGYRAWICQSATGGTAELRPESHPFVCSPGIPLRARKPMRTSARNPSAGMLKP
jgi:hypothetical protein